jgi:hAT family C-terminal dimerisation region
MTVRYVGFSAYMAIAHIFVVLFSIENIFDSLPTLVTSPAADHTDELKYYLDSDPENISDPLLWWTRMQNVYPCLSQMALDYLSIPGKSWCVALACMMY